MPKKTPVITGPVLNRGSVTANTKTQRHNAVMWSHMAGKNYDQVKKVEIIKYEVSSIKLFGGIAYGTYSTVFTRYDNDKD